MNNKLKAWAKAAAIRAVRTFALALAGGITVGAALHEISWGYLASVSAVAAIYSLVTSLAGLPEVPDEDNQD